MSSLESNRVPAAVLAEDEVLLADELEDLLRALWPQLRIVSRVCDGVAALAAVDSHLPDLAFLDIHMPRLNGIEVARQIAGRCHVAFITSYDQYAIDAFEAGAVELGTVKNVRSPLNVMPLMEAELPVLLPVAVRTVTTFVRDQAMGFPFVKRATTRYLTKYHQELYAQLFSVSTDKKSSRKKQHFLLHRRRSR